MSLDSSDDENVELFREAVDANFIHDGMFAAKPTQNSNLTNQPSLRPAFNKDDQFTNVLGVSPQFQQHVASRLSKLLEESLQEKLLKFDCTREPNMPRKRKKGGIKLFSNSRKFIKLSKYEEKATMKVKVHNKNDSCDKLKCSEAAIDPQDILDQNELKNWSTKSRAQVFRYKKAPNGALTSLD